MNVLNNQPLLDIGFPGIGNEEYGRVMQALWQGQVVWTSMVSLVPPTPPPNIVPQPQGNEPNHDLDLS